MSAPVASEAARLLVVEDDDAVARALAGSLSAVGYRVDVATTAADGLERAAAGRPDAIVLDLLLPDGSGLEVCRRLREWSTVPVIVVSAVHDEDEKVALLDAGADDYVTKPFRVGELLARVRAALRRRASSEGEGEERALVRFGAVEADFARREVRRAGQPVHLTPTEYELLRILAQQPGRLLTHSTLLVAVWGSGAIGQTHRLRMHIASLRRKLEDDPAQPRHLLTEAGVGYRLSPQP